MDTRKWITPLLLIGLFAAFAAVNTIVFLQKGKREKWIARKMKIGAALLTLTAITSGCVEPPVITCYDPAPSNYFVFDQIDQTDYSVVADLPNDSILTGKVLAPEFDKYTFEIISSDSVTAQKGDVIATDGLFDEESEEFKIDLNSKLDTGKYQINIKTAGLNQGESYVVTNNWLRIK